MQFPEETRNEAQRILQKQRQAYFDKPFPSCEERRENLLKLEQILVDNQDAIKTSRELMKQEGILSGISSGAAVHAALTGHKVLTTFHTEDSIGGLLRLMNMDIETFLISSTVVSVLAQRLLRRVCIHCAEPYVPTPLDLRRLGYEQKDFRDANFLQGRGCSHCRYTGYSGRIGIHELLVLNDAIKDSILEKQSSSVIRGVSKDAAGLVTLMEDGIVKAASGDTSLAEVLRFLPRIERPRPLNKIRRLVGVAYE
jgi:type IV pilus assembly protein PilB